MWISLSLSAPLSSYEGYSRMRAHTKHSRTYLLSQGVDFQTTTSFQWLEIGRWLESSLWLSPEKNARNAAKICRLVHNKPPESGLLGGMERGRVLQNKGAWWSILMFTVLWLSGTREAFLPQEIRKAVNIALLYVLFIGRGHSLCT